MFTKRMIMTATAMVAVSASVAMAGTKYQATIVTASVAAPPTNPTLSAGKVSVKDTGSVKVGVKGVTDGAGALVDTGSTAVKDTGSPDADSYIAIVKMNYTALDVDVEIAVPMDVKKGNGKGALDLSGLTSLLLPMTGREIEVTGGEVWGPLGLANVAACTAELATGYAIGSSACKQGDKLGVAGINIP